MHVCMYILITVLLIITFTCAPDISLSLRVVNAHYLFILVLEVEDLRIIVLMLFV